MSALDDLDRFDREWQRHLNDRLRSRKQQPANRFYFDGAKLQIANIPDALQGEFYGKVEKLIEGALGLLSQKKRGELAALARAEAEHTLARLSASPEPKPALPEDFPEWPKEEP